MDTTYIFFIYYIKNMPYTESQLQSRFGTNAPPTIRELALQTVNLKEDTINDRYINKKHGEIQKRLLSERNEHATQYANEYANASNDANDDDGEQEEQTDEPQEQENEQFLKRKNPVKLHGGNTTKDNSVFTIVAIAVFAALGIAMICCGAATMKKKK